MDRFARISEVVTKSAALDFTDFDDLQNLYDAINASSIGLNDFFWLDGFLRQVTQTDIDNA